MPPKGTPQRLPPRRNNTKAALLEESPNLASAEDQEATDQSQNAIFDGDLAQSTASPAFENGDPPQTSTSASASTPSTSTRRPVQRLDSLRRRNQPLATLTSGSSESRPVGLKFQPKAATRRSKEEREAQGRAEDEKRQARLAATRENASSPVIRGAPFSRGAGRGGTDRAGRGWGMYRWQQQRSGVGQASGPLSGGPSRGQTLGKRKASRGGHQSVAASNLEPSISGSTVTNVKKESVSRTEKDRGVETSTRGPTRARESKVKHEDSGLISVSSDEGLDDLEGPRVNIEHINLISDEESDEDSAIKNGKCREKSIRPLGWNLKPIRIDRHEHVERAIGVSTEASSSTSAEIRKKAQERGQAEDSLLAPDDGEMHAIKTSQQKGKARTKDVEFVRDERRWKGVYRENDANEEDARIKQEPKDDDTIMDRDSPAFVETQQPVEIASVSSSAPSVTVAPEITQGKAISSEKAKRRAKLGSRESRPVLQTEEDRQEWARYEEDIMVLSEELGFMDTGSVPAPTSEGHETNVEAKGGVSAERKDRKEGLVYMFQLPPIIPNLIDPVKKETNLVAEKGQQLTISSSAAASSSKAPAHEASDVKLKTGGRGLPSMDDKITNAFMAGDADISQGAIGTLSVHESGRVVMSWGGANLEVGRGGGGELLQEVILAEMEKEHDSDIEMKDDNGHFATKSALAMGQLSGGFVVTPDWEAMFEG
ncbi:hypothetical protein MMC20_003158 [Loxospora ochrophaea]|nr:hypothetical protein [Loxospora ochrophaea]